MKDKPCHISAISNKILKNICNIIAPVLSKIINRSLSQGVFPDLLKKARVVPIFKAGDETDVNNYRPISVLPVLSKIFERVMYNRILSFFERFHVLDNNQYGFRKKKSTIHAIMSNLERIYQSLDKGYTVLSIFVDFRKAFDCVDHTILMSKLYKYGIRGAAYHWFKSYLSNRSQYTCINSCSSDPASISVGVPQGSILGPLLFLIHINDFPKCNTFFNFTLFADDSTLSCVFENDNPEVMANVTENQLIPVANWLNQNKLTINHKKTQFIVFSYRKNIVMRDIKFGSDLIKQTNSTKFLGIQIDEHLKFDKQINSLCNKISKTVGILFKLNKFMPINILKTLYDSLILPYLSYGIEIWYSAPNYLTNRVEILQKKAIRAINNLPFNDHTHAYFRDMRLLKLGDLYLLNLMTDMYRRVGSGEVSVDSIPIAHQHDTRNRNQYINPRFNRTSTQNSFLYQQIIKWNAVPLNIKECSDKTKFKIKLKDYIMAQYP